MADTVTTETPIDRGLEAFRKNGLEKDGGNPKPEVRRQPARPNSRQLDSPPSESPPKPERRHPCRRARAIFLPLPPAPSKVKCRRLATAAFPESRTVLASAA